MNFYKQDSKTVIFRKCSAVTVEHLLYRSKLEIN